MHSNKAHTYNEIFFDLKLNLKIRIYSNLLPWASVGKNVILLVPRTLPNCRLAVILKHELKCGNAIIEWSKYLNILRYKVYNNKHMTHQTHTHTHTYTCTWTHTLTNICLHLHIRQITDRLSLNKKYFNHVFKND